MPGTKALLHLPFCFGKEKGGCLLAAGDGSNTLYLGSNFNMDSQLNSDSGRFMLCSVHG